MRHFSNQVLTDANKNQNWRFSAKTNSGPPTGHLPGGLLLSNWLKPDLP